MSEDKTPKTDDEIIAGYEALEYEAFGERKESYRALDVEEMLKQARASERAKIAQEMETLKLQRKVCLSPNVNNDLGLSITWLEIWDEVEKWYGDPHKKESGHAFLLRLQDKYSHSVTQEHAVPQCLQDFNISGLARLVNESWNDQGINVAILSEKINEAAKNQFYLLLSHVKGLPTKEWTYEDSEIPENGVRILSDGKYFCNVFNSGSAHILCEMLNQASLALLQLDEEHRKEVERLQQELVKDEQAIAKLKQEYQNEIAEFADWIVWNRFVPHGLPLRKENNWHPLGKTTIYKTIDLYAKFKEEREEK